MKRFSAVPYVFCAVCLTILGQSVQAQQAQDSISPKVYVDGTYIGEGYNVSHSLMVPAQKLAAKLGYKIEINEKSSTVYLTSNTRKASHAWLPVEESRRNVRI